MKFRAGYCAIVACAFFAHASAYARELAPSTSAESVCKFVAQEMGSRIWWPSYGKSGGAYASLEAEQGTVAHGDFKDNYSVRYGVFDIDGDGRPDQIRPNGYSMNNDDTSHITFSTGIDGDWAKGELPGNRFTSPRYEGWWLPYRGHMYELAFDDQEGAYISTVTYFTSKGKHLACGFKNKLEDAYWRGSVGADAFPPEHDRAAKRDNVTDFIRLHGLPTAIAAETLPADVKQSIRERGEEMLGAGTKEEWQVACDANPCKAIWEIDFNNDGKPDRLIKFRSGENEAFLLMEKDDLAPQSSQRLLAEISSGPLNLRRNWVLIDGRYYLERKGPLYHDLFLYLPDVRGRFAEATVKVEPSITYQHLMEE